MNGRARARTTPAAHRRRTRLPLGWSSVACCAAHGSRCRSQSMSASRGEMARGRGLQCCSSWGHSRQPERRQAAARGHTGNHGGLRARRGRLARGLTLEPERARPGSAETQNPGSAGTTQTRAAPAEEEREYFKATADAPHVRPSWFTEMMFPTGCFTNKTLQLKSRLRSVFYLVCKRCCRSVCVWTYARVRVLHPWWQLLLDIIPSHSGSQGNTLHYHRHHYTGTGFFFFFTPYLSVYLIWYDLLFFISTIHVKKRCKCDVPLPIFFY